MSTKGRESYGRISSGAFALAASMAVAAGAADAPVQASLGGPSRASNLYAVVDLAGSLVQGNGVTGVTHISTGQYEVTFEKDVSKCAYLANTANAYSQALSAFTAGGHLSSSGVYVETKNQGGGLTDGPFHLAVVCGGKGTSFAVVGYSADLVRATRGTKLTALGFGRYEVRFPALGLGSCAYIATVGDPDNALVYSPSGVYTGSGANRRTVYIETKNPGGGLQDGVPFHVARVCESAPNTQVAVVAVDGVADRSSKYTASVLASTGNYLVATHDDLSACATIATRGSVDAAVPYSPATVEIVPSPANAVGVQVRNLLFFGGALLNEAFHSATFCK